MRKLSILLSEVALVVASPALAQSASPIKWAAGPSAGDVADALMGKPAADGMPGHVQLHCKIAASGELTSCAVAQEEPRGKGFGDAALAIAAKMRVASTPDRSDEIDLPLRFDASPPLRPLRFARVLGAFSHLAPIGGYYPERAVRSHVSGYALAECHLAATGSLSRCTILDEQPAGWAFPEAALRMAQAGYMKAEPRVVDGQPVADEVVRVLVKFNAGHP